MLERGPPVDLLALVQGEVLEGQSNRQDAPGGGAAYEVEQLVDAPPCALLQLPQLLDYGHALRQNCVSVGPKAYAPWTEWSNTSCPTSPH